jgi:flagellar hook-associated protein 1 FlgK
MSLNASLSIAVQSLLANNGALQATNNNIANANTPGYSRQTVVLQAAAPSSGDALDPGNGVVLEGFQSVRSELLQMQIQQQTQAQSGANAQLGSLQQIEPVFTTSTQDIGTQMAALFSSISNLSTDPTNSSLRQGVLAAGQNLASAFNSASTTLSSTQTGLNAQVDQDVSQINVLTKQIAALNPVLAAMKANGQDGGSVQDQQDQLVLSLSKLTSVAVTKTESGNTLTTGNGTPLVVGATSYTLQTTTGSDGMRHVLTQNGQDITATLTGGDLGGAVQMRDTTIPGLLSQLDTLASQFGTAFNAAQAKGFDQNGAVGGNFFALPTAVGGTAAAIKLALTSPAGVAASSDGSAGSNGNVISFSAVQTTNLPAGDTPGNSYAGLVYQVASATSQAQAESTATAAGLLQLQDQQSAISGVSIDEEATNLVRYQQAYAAAARVVTTIQTLFEVTMAMAST